VCSKGYSYVGYLDSWLARELLFFFLISLYHSVLLEFFPSQISVVPTFFISLDIVFHEQDLCSCVLHVVYHGVQEMSS